MAAATYRYRGREITAADILYIKALIAAEPGASRRTISKKLCAAWDWRQSNGALRDMVCRGMLLMLDRAGQIALPPVSYVRHNPLAQRARPAPMLLDTTPITDPLGTLQPLEFQQVRRTSDEPLFNGLMEETSLSGLRTAGRRASEVLGMGAEPAGGLRGVVLGAAPHRQP